MSQPTPVATTWVNGQVADNLPVTDRGLAYGDGLFETLRASRGMLPLLALHLERLRRGCEVLRIPFDRALIEAELGFAAAAVGDGVVKLTLTRGTGPRGYAMPADPKPTRVIAISPLPVYPVGRRDGVQLFCCTTRLSDQPLLAGIKHLNRLEQVLARSEWQDPAYAEGLVCDQQGSVVEGTMSNLFARIDGQWVTPELSRCGVQGVMRDYLLSQLLERGQPTVVSTLSLEALQQADQVFCCNSLIGVWPVVRLGDRVWQVGHETRLLQSLAEQVYL